MILKMMRKHRRSGIIAALAVVVEALLELVIPYLMAEVIDRGVMSGDTDFIIRRGLVMIVLALLAFGLGLVYARMSARFAFGVGADLRRSVFAKLQAYSFHDLDQFDQATLTTRLTSDVTLIQNTINTAFRPMMRAPGMLLTALFLSFQINARLALVFLVAAPLLGVGLFFIVRHVRPRFAALQRSIDRVNRIVAEDVQGIRTIKAYISEADELGRFDTINEDVQTQGVHALGLASLNMPMFQAVMYTTVMAILLFGAGMVRANTLQVGELTGFLSYVLQVLNSMMMLSNVFLMISRSDASRLRIAQLLAVSTDREYAKQAIEFEDGSVVFNHVSFRYDTRATHPVLEDISFSVASGMTVGLIGTTGSAKSTLMMLLAGLYTPQSGTINVGGHPVADYPEAVLRKAIAMVLQTNTLFSGTIAENLRWGDAKATPEQMRHACAMASCLDLIERFPEGLDARVEEGGANFSGGQRQRLCLARALLQAPKIMILDDATSALDRTTEQRIWTALREELSTLTVFIIAQRIASVLHADQIILLDNGRIRAMGTHEQLLAADDLYAQIFIRQMEGSE